MPELIRAVSSNPDCLIVLVFDCLPPGVHNRDRKRLSDAIPWGDHVRSLSKFMIDLMDYCQQEDKPPRAVVVGPLLARLVQRQDRFNPRNVKCGERPCIGSWRGYPVHLDDRFPPDKGCFTTSGGAPAGVINLTNTPAAIARMCLENRPG